MRPFSILLFLLATGSTSDVQACTCIGNRTGDQAFKSSTAVFVGEVIEIRPVRFRELTESEMLARHLGSTALATSYQVRFLVEEAWKGLDGVQEAVVGTSMEGASCGFAFDVGQRYVVFAHGQRGSLGASICSATGLVEDSAAMMRFLRRKARGDFRSLVAGRIGWTDDDPAGMVSDSSGQEVPVTLLLQGPGVHRRIRPQAGGRFEIDDLPPGTYRLELELPSHYDPDPYEYNFELANPIDFADPNISPPRLPAGGIEMSIRDAVGRALPRMAVLLNQSETQASIENSLLRAKHLSPGQYSLAFPVEGTSKGEMLYYPNGRNSDEAEMIEVEAGQITRPPEWQLPFEVQPVLLKGTVLLPDQRPAAGAVVALNTDMLSLWATADQQGRFQFRYYLPFRYRLESIFKDAELGEHFRLEPMDWPPEVPPAGPIRLILQ